MTDETKLQAEHDHAECGCPLCCPDKPTKMRDEIVRALNLPPQSMIADVELGWRLFELPYRIERALREALAERDEQWRQECHRAFSVEQGYEKVKQDVTFEAAVRAGITALTEQDET